MPYWGGQTADRLIEGGYGTVLETHWLLTRTTGASPLQMDTQVGSQVGKEGGGLLCQFCVLLGVCARVCVCLHTVTSGPWSTDMSDKGFINEATLHPSGRLQHHTVKTATDLMSLLGFQYLNSLLYLYSKCFVSYCYLPSTTGKSAFSSYSIEQIHKIVRKVMHEPPHRARHNYNYQRPNCFNIRWSFFSLSSLFQPFL